MGLADWIIDNTCPILILIFFFTVLPQPVYMNMSDLASMAAQKAQNFQQNHPTIEEESPDLKTPTAEELQVPGVQKVTIAESTDISKLLITYSS